MEKHKRLRVTIKTSEQVIPNQTLYFATQTTQTQNTTQHEAKRRSQHKLPTSTRYTLRAATETRRSTTQDKGKRELKTHTTSISLHSPTQQQPISSHRPPHIIIPSPYLTIPHDTSLKTPHTRIYPRPTQHRTWDHILKSLAAHTLTFDRVFEGVLGHF